MKSYNNSIDNLDIISISRLPFIIKFYKNYNEIQNWNSLNLLCEVKKNVSSVLKYSAIFLTQTFLRLVQMKLLNYLKLCLNFVCTL